MYKRILVMDNLIDDVVMEICLKVKTSDLLSFCLTQKRIYKLYISKSFWYNYFNYNRINLSKQITLIINSNEFKYLSNILNMIKKINNTRSVKKRIDCFMSCYNKNYKNVCELLIDKRPELFSISRLEKWLKLPDKYNNIVDKIKTVFFNCVKQENKKLINQFHISLIDDDSFISFDGVNIYESEIKTNILDLFNKTDEICVSCLYEYEANNQDDLIVSFGDRGDNKTPFDDNVFESNIIKNKIHIKYIEKYFKKELNKVIQDFPFVKIGITENQYYIFIDICIMTFDAFERNYHVAYSNSSDSDSDDHDSGGIDNDSDND